MEIMEKREVPRQIRKAETLAWFGSTSPFLDLRTRGPENDSPANLKRSQALDYFLGPVGWTQAN